MKTQKPHIKVQLFFGIFCRGKKLLSLNQNNMSGIIGGVKANRGIDLDNP